MLIVDGGTSGQSTINSQPSTINQLCVSEATRKRNPDLFGNVLAAVGAARAERNKVSALDGGGKERRQRKGRVEPCCRVLLIACRHREIDDDSNVYSLKPLRDAIANAFALDDADGRIQWDYGQAITRGEQGVIVRIEAV